VQLLSCQNADGLDPLGVALEYSQFPRGDLHIFTKPHVKMDSKVKDFLRVARQSPPAAAQLLRQGTTNERIDVEWRAALRYGALEQMVTADGLADLIIDAPQAAVDIFDALSSRPRVEDKLHNPLPRLVALKRKSQLNLVNVCYVQDSRWVWDSGRKEKTVTWQKRLADEDGYRGEEVQIRVLQLKGVISTGMVHALAGSGHMKLLSTRLEVHGVLSYVWDCLSWIFVLDRIHDVAGLGTITLWACGPWIGEPSAFVHRFLWGLVAAQAVKTCFIRVHTGIAFFSFHRKQGEKKTVWDRKTALYKALCKTGQFIHWGLARSLIGVLTMILVIDVDPGEWPRRNSSIPLAANCVVHWMVILYELRAFRWTGSRLLPIVRSVQETVFSMIFIILFLVGAFMSAFWALDRGRADEGSMFDVTVFLLTGNAFMGSSEVLKMDHFRTWASIVLTATGIFVFVACVLNVFIEVLGDRYDTEQNNIVASFLETRAQILSDLLLRPYSRKLQTLLQRHAGNISARARFTLHCISVVIIFTLYMAILSITSDMEDGPVARLLPAAVLTVCMLFMQLVHRSSLSVDWDECYLWLCFEHGIEERIALGGSLSDDKTGRTSRLQDYVKNQCGSLREQVQSLEAAVRNKETFAVTRL